MPARFTRTLPYLVIALLVACGGDSSPSPKAAQPADAGVVVEPANAAGKPTGTPNANATATARAGASQPGAALTPRPGTSSDLAVARRLESEGDYEGASQSYLAVAAQKRDDTIVAATEGAARMLLAQDKPADVKILLESFLIARNDGPSHYMLARAYTALSQYDLALKEYETYIASGRPAVPYAYSDRARVLLNLGRPVDAAASVQAGAALGLPDSQKRTSFLAAAQDQERAGNLSSAIVAYQALLDASSGTADDKAIALSRIEALKQLQGDPSWVDAQQRLLAGYPASSQAIEELRAADARGDEISPTVRAVIYYRQNDYTSAEPILRQVLEAAPNDKSSADAAYYLAAIDESHDKTDDAEKGYARSVELNPDSTLADDALWWRGRILENDNKLDEARGLYQRITTDYPSSTWAGDAAFRGGLLQYRASKYRDAIDIWSARLNKVVDSTEQQRLSLWRAKALLKAGDKAGATIELQALARSSELDYFGMRANSLLQNKNGQPKATREAKIDLNPAFDWPAAEAWLVQKTGRSITDTTWAQDKRWLRAQELWLVGRDTQANAEAFDLMDANQKDPLVMYGMARALQATGHIGLSGRAGQRLLRTLQTNPNAGLPKALLSLSYPPAFASLVQKRAQDAGISPLLMLAFIRQESFFDPRAQAPDGGLGLTQVQPDTGQAIAKKLDVDDYSDDDLLIADNSLRFGASYMADQLKTFDNEVFPAFGAYNAGPVASTRWRKTSGGEDPDVYLESVEFSITRLYVQLVGENYAIYRYLYSGEPTPDWP